MNDDKLNSFLDGEIDLEGLDQETRRAALEYLKVVRVAKVRFDYHPGVVAHDKILRKIKSRRGLIFELLVAGAAALAVFVVATSSLPKKVVPESVQRASVNEIFDYLSLVKLVNDGF